MVNEEHVKIMTRLASYEKYDGKACNPMAEYYHEDYIWKQILISIVTGTMVFLLFVVLAVFQDLEAVLSIFQELDIPAAARAVGWRYGLFMGVYLLITYLIYRYRYAKGRKQVKRYYAQLGALEKLYEKEEQDTRPMGGVQ